MVFLLLSVALVVFWIFLTEVPVAYAPVVGANAERPGTFVRVMFIVVMLTLFVLSVACQSGVETFWADGFVPGSFFGAGKPEWPYIVVIVSASAFITTVLAKQFTAYPSVVYAFMGALWGYELFAANQADWGNWLRVVGCWIAAPLASAIMGALFYYICWRVLRSTHWHLYRIYAVLKYVLLVAAGLFTIGMVVNNGKMLLWMIQGQWAHPWGICVVLGFLLLGFFMMHRPLEKRLQKMVLWEFDVNVQTSLAVTLSGAVALLLCPVPLSIPSVMFAALLGCGLVQRKETLEGATYRRMFLTHAAAPAVALFLCYNLCILFSTKNIAQRLDTNLILFFVLLFVSAAVFLILHYHQKMTELKKHVGRVQQEQAFESQKALNAVDVKTVLAENQNLHQRLEQKRSELINVALNISEQKEFIDLLYSKMRVLDTCQDPEQRDVLLKEVKSLLLQRKSFSQEIDSFYAQAESLHKDFALTLNEKFPNLTAQEKKLATLLRLGFSSKEIATLMNVSAKSAEIGRYRLRKKLNLSHEDNLIQFIKSI